MRSLKAGFFPPPYLQKFSVCYYYIMMLTGGYSQSVPL